MATTAVVAGVVAAQHGIRVIAMSRFGYLRTPMPAAASAAAQADAHVCLLDALGIRRAAAMGGSAGAPSALQMALRHPDRVSALILVLPLTHKPPTQADSAAPMPAWVENTMMHMLGSNFLFWAAIHVARMQVINAVLTTPPELLTGASQQERARVNAMIDNILPVSARAAELRSDTAVGKHLAPAALEALRVPTLIVSSWPTWARSRLPGVVAVLPVIRHAGVAQDEAHQLREAALGPDAVGQDQHAALALLQAHQRVGGLAVVAALVEAVTLRTVEDNDAHVDISISSLGPGLAGCRSTGRFEQIRFAGRSHRRRHPEVCFPKGDLRE